MAAGQIAENIARIQERIQQAAIRAGRDPSAITLAAVTKTVDPPLIYQAYGAGIRDFGESYVQEALAKQNDDLMKRQDMRWHFIGHLQSNKVRQIAGRFVLIHSVDSLSLAREIGKRALPTGKPADILLEIKLDPAGTKFGFAPEAAVEAAGQVQEAAGIRLCGLMGMAPFSSDPENARPYFRQLRGLFEQLPAESRQTLSMGMSGDFEIAVEEGATLVRIGTAIFGKRP